MCIEYIYRHIGKLPKTQLFTSREVLIYGTRSAVDAALCRLVKSGFIKRMARGVFIQDDSKKPSLIEIVQAKARAFQMVVVECSQIALTGESARSTQAGERDYQDNQHHERNRDDEQHPPLAAKHDASNSTEYQKPRQTFAKTGHSCSFWTVQGRAEIKGMSARKVHLITSSVGKVVQTLWNRGRRFCLNSDVQQLTRHFGRLERRQFWLHGANMPYWLNEMCRPRYPQVRNL